MKIEVYDNVNNILIGEGNEISNKIIYFIFNNLDSNFIVCPINLLENKIRQIYKRKIKIKFVEESL